MSTKNLKLHKEKGKYGYKDESGNWVIEPKFMIADEFERGIARVELDGLWGFLKEDGSWLVEPNLHYAYPFSNELAPVQKGFYKGYINRKGEWFVPPVLDDYWGFGENSVVEITDKDNKRAYISNEGKWITGFEFDSLITYDTRAGFMVDKRIRVRKNDKYGFLDPEGNWVVPPVYAQAWNFNEGRTFVAKESNSRNYYLIDLDGNVILDSLDPKTNIENGKAIVKVRTAPIDRNLYETFKAGIIDKDGKWIVPPIYDEITDAADGFFFMTINDLKGLIDETGKVIIKPEYEKLESAFPGYFTIKVKKKYGLANKEGKVIFAPKFDGYFFLRKDGLVRFSVKDKYGLADLNGKIIVKPILDTVPEEFQGSEPLLVKTQGKYGWINKNGEFLGVDLLFEEAHNFSEGLAAVRSNGLWGFISDKGTLDIEPQFDEIHDFNNGLAVVNISGHWGMIDKEGEWIVEPKFDEIKEFYEGMAPAKIFNPKARSSKWGLIDEKGQFIIKPEFENLENFKKDLFKAKSDGKWGLIDEKGDWILNPAYEGINDFRDGYAEIVNDGLVGLIDSEYKVVVEPKYDEIKGFSDGEVAQVNVKNKTGFINKEGIEIVPVMITDYWSSVARTKYYWVKTKGKWGYLDINEGRWIIEPKYKEVAFYGDPSMLRVKIDGKWGVIDYQDNVLISPIFDSYDDLDRKSFYNGFKRLEIDGKQGFYNISENKWELPPNYEKAEYVGKGLFLITENGKKCILDSKGNNLLGKCYEDILPYIKDKVLWIKDNGKYGVTDLDGQWTVEPVFDKIGFKYKVFNRLGLTKVAVGDSYAVADKKGTILGNNMFESVSDFENDYAIVEKNGKFGLIDSEGKEIVPPLYESLDFPSNGFIRAQENKNHYGFIDLNGNWVIPPKYSWVEIFKNNYARATLDDEKFGVIDMKGDWIIEPKFQKLEELRTLTVAEEDGKYGYIDLYGNWVAPPIYKSAETYCNEFGKVTTDDYKTGYIDRNGKFYSRKPN